MKCIILAAGYATRMYPLTKDFPKPLLTIGGSTILDRLLDDLEQISEIDECVVITNHRFIDIFSQWNDGQNRRFSITILDDGSTENENRLGAVRDLKFAIDQCAIEDDVLVLAGDNLLDFSCAGFVAFSKEKQHSCIMYHYQPEVARLQRTGVVEFDGNGKILGMQEKPEKPATHYAVPPFYIYRKEDLHWITEAIEQGCNVDAPGNLLAWMCGFCEMYAYEMPGNREDVGCLEDYERLKAQAEIGR